MIRGIIRRSIGVLKTWASSKLVVAAIPRDKITNAVRKGGLRLEADVAHQIPDIGEGFGDIARLHRQHILYRRPAQLLLQQRHQNLQFFRVWVADIVDPRRWSPGGRRRNVIDQPRYDTGHVADISEVAA